MTEALHDLAVRAPAETSSGSVDAHNPTGGVPGLLAEKTQSWGLISADVISRAAGEVSWLSDHHRISLVLTEMSGTASIDGGPARPVRLFPGSLSFCPAGVSALHTLPAGPMLQLRQSPETCDTIITELVRGGTIDLEHRSPIDDPLISQIASTIAHEMESGFLDRILVDALNTALAVRIVQQFVEPSKIALEPSNGLSRERVQRVCDYIEAHLDDRLILEELAGWPVSAPFTSAARSSRRLASVHNVTSCSGGSNGQKP